jgi:hypothetical protein
VDIASLWILFTTILWLISLIGCSVTGMLFIINVGSGHTDWQKRFWWKFCKQNLKWFSLFLPLFILANYFYYLIFNNL